MTEPVMLPEPTPSAEPAETGALPTDQDDPWHGIPAEVLDRGPVYDADTPGGCG